MTKSYRSDYSVRKLLAKMDFIILPVFNVDGYSYTWVNPDQLIMLLCIYLST